MDESLIRGVVASAAIATLIVLQLWFPFRSPQSNRWARYRDNFALFLVSAGLVWLVIPVTLTGVAFHAQREHIGLFNWLELRFGLAFVLGLIVLDLLMYLQHLLMHRVPLLWRLHRVHHSDEDLDWSTGIRFHPLEIIVSTLLKIGAVLLLGVPPVAVLVFEILLNVFSLFTHSNLALPGKFDHRLKWLVVTPSMHWVHHSRQINESRSNFGFCLSVWDRVFSTFRARAERETADLLLGVEGLKQHSTGPSALLYQPLINDPEADQYPF